MVVKAPTSWARSLFSLRRTALGEIGPRVLTAVLIAVGVTAVERKFGVGSLDLTPVPFSLIGLAIGIFLGFRGKTAYDRFWEGRTLWGGLVNQSRTATRQVLCLLQAPEAETSALRELQKKAVYLLIAYVNALRHLLRQTPPWDDLARYLDENQLASLKEHRNPPLAVLQQLAELLGEARRREWLHEFHVPVMDQTLSELTNLQGGCERIRNTPVPYAYSIMSHRTVAVFCFFLPFGIVDDVKGYTPFVTALVAYAFFGLDALGSEVEEPFGTDPHDLPLTAICTTIEINLRQLLGETELPANPTPVNDILE